MFKGIINMLKAKTKTVKTVVKRSKLPYRMIKMNIGKDNKAFVNNGTWGFYFKLDKTTGVKVHCTSEHGLAPTKISSINYEAVEKEFKTQSEAFKLLGSIVPEAYEIVVIKHKKRYYTGFTMKHIDADNLGDMPWDDYSRGIEDKVFKVLQSNHLDKPDCGSHNILVKGDKFWIIDWGLGATYKGKKVA